MLDGVGVFVGGRCACASSSSISVLLVVCDAIYNAIQARLNRVLLFWFNFNLGVVLFFSAFFCGPPTCELLFELVGGYFD